MKKHKLIMLGLFALLPALSACKWDFALEVEGMDECGEEQDAYCVEIQAQ